jgi:hypothetical protein
LQERSDHGLAGRDEPFDEKNNRPFEEQEDRARRNLDAWLFAVMAAAASVIGNRRRTQPDQVWSYTILAAKGQWRLIPAIVNQKVRIYMAIRRSSGTIMMFLRLLFLSNRRYHHLVPSMNATASAEIPATTYGALLFGKRELSTLLWNPTTAKTGRLMRSIYLLFSSR